MIKNLHKTLLFASTVLLYSCSEIETDFKENSLVQGKKTEIVSSIDPAYDIDESQINITSENAKYLGSISNSEIDWKNWFLSIPIDNGKSDLKAKSIYYQTILEATYPVQVNEYFSWNEDEKGINLFSHFTGYTTSGYAAKGKAQYCRTELREFWRGNQDIKDNWTMDSSTHILESTLKVLECENTADQCEVIVAQINGIENDIAGEQVETVKVKWQSGNLVLECFTKPTDGTDAWSANYSMEKSLGFVGNEKFTIKLKVDQGALYVALHSTANAIDHNYAKLYDYVANDYSYENYFRTGNYFPHSDNYSDYSNVILYKVKTDHN